MIVSFVFVLKHFHQFLTGFCSNVYDMLDVYRDTSMAGFGA